MNAQEQIQQAPSIADKTKEPSRVFPLTVEYPYEGAVFKDAYPKMFVYGQVNPAGGSLKINGQDTPVYKTGSYFAYIPTKPGVFNINLEFDDGENIYIYKRSVNIEAFDYTQYLNSNAFDLKYTYPLTDALLTAGDSITLTAAGTPGKKVKMTLKPYFKNLEMIEDPKAPGIYTSTITFRGESYLKKPQRVSYIMYDGKNRVLARASSRGEIKTTPPDKIMQAAKVKVENSRIRPLAKTGVNILDTKLFGRVEITGLLDNFYRVALGGDNIGWIETNFLEPAKHYSVPKNKISAVTTETREDKTIITITNKERVSFKTDLLKNSFDIILYYTDAADNASAEVESPLISRLEYGVISPGVKKISAVYNKGQSLWGYRYEYKGNTLVFELYHKPVFAFTKQQPLKGLKVFLDPGHGPIATYAGEGTISPSGVLEYKPNYDITLAAQKALEAMGAQVILSKTEMEMMPLFQRTEAARKKGADIFISVHNNSLPNNIDPFARERGFGIYYYHKHSVPLARALEAAYIKHIPLPNNGIIEMDLFVTRNTPQIPAVLIENAFMIFPEQEELLLNSDSVAKFGRTIAEGVLRFVNPAAAKLPNYGMEQPKKMQKPQRRKAAGNTPGNKKS